jgi:hypothetical protein
MTCVLEAVGWTQWRCAPVLQIAMQCYKRCVVIDTSCCVWRPVSVELHVQERLATAHMCLCVLQLWEETQYHGAVPVSKQDVQLAASLSRTLDGLIAEESRYELPPPPASSPNAWGARRAFRSEREAALGLQSRRRVCGALEHDLGQPMDVRRNVLFIIGTQKGGTTFLFNALKKHPSFIGADHAYGCAALAARRCVTMPGGCDHAVLSRVRSTDQSYSGDKNYK